MRIFKIQSSYKFHFKEKFENSFKKDESIFPGRIHLATISSVDAENQLVLVEWLENDESKGKEVCTHLECDHKET